MNAPRAVIRASKVRYRMYIDDLRTPDIDYDIIVRSSDEAIKCIKEHGMPSFISFDHDLGGGDTSMKVVNFIVESLLDDDFSMEVDFDFKIHSANPIGAANIDTKMRNIIKFMRK